MTIAQLMQLYAPLAGLLAVVFWLGVLSERVRALAERVKALERARTDGRDDHDLLVKLETTQEAMLARLDSFDRALQNVQRQLGNIMVKGGAKIIELGDH